MLGYLVSLKDKNFDCISFLDGDKEDEIMVRGSHYSDFGEKAPGSPLGDMYHIITFRDSHEEEGCYGEFESCEGILIDPLEYISRMIQLGYYGIVSKKTSTSEKFVQRLLDFLQTEEYTDETN